MLSLSVFICYLISIKLYYMLLLSVFICYLISIKLYSMLLLSVFICYLISIKMYSMLLLLVFFCYPIVINFTASSVLSYCCVVMVCPKKIVPCVLLSFTRLLFLRLQTFSKKKIKLTCFEKEMIANFLWKIHGSKHKKVFFFEKKKCAPRG